jgi:uncharacterized protein YjbI with pentapeptide repeats
VASRSHHWLFAFFAVLSPFFFSFLISGLCRVEASNDHLVKVSGVLRYVDEEKISAKFLCSICQAPAVDPLVHDGNCNSLFCKGCIMKWLGKNQTCPKCRAPCSKATLSNSDFIAGLLHELHVFCPNEEHGCKWTGERGDVLEHIKRFCERVPCDMEGCTAVVPGAFMEKHLSTCEFVIESCPAACGEEVTRREMHQHLKTCPKRQEQLTRIKRQEQLCDVLNPTESDVFFINCGGRIFTATRSVLTKFPESVLGTMFAEQFRKVNRDAQGHIHIASAADVFGHVLTWLQYDALPPTLNEFEVALLEKEATKWELGELTECVVALYAAKDTKKKKGDAINLTQDFFFQLVAMSKDGNGNARVSLPNTDLQHIRLAGINLSGSCFRHCIASRVEFTSCMLFRCDFSHADLESADFRNCVATGSNFTVASRNVVKAENCNVPTCNFTGANLMNADFRNCVPCGDFTNANLTGADFRGSWLYGCSFRGAKLDDTLFEGACVIGMSVGNGDWQTMNFGKGVAMDDRCKCPDGTKHVFFGASVKHVCPFVLYDCQNDQSKTLSMKLEWENRWGGIELPKWNYSE